jgi:predicted kinase
VTPPPRPLLVVVSGLPGTGKSAVAEGLAARLRMVHLAIDVVEEAMLTAGQARGWTTGVAAYEVAGSVAAANLALGNDVCVDAVNDSEPARDTWRRSAAQGSARLHFLVTACSDPREHRRRLEGRKRPFEQVAEPTWSDVQRRAEQYATWTDPYDLLDTMQPPAVVLQAALQAIGRDRGVLPLTRHGSRT